MKQFITLLFILCFIITADTLAADKKKHDVLILHSYHATFPWTRSINDALLEKLNKDKNGFNVIVEYMDTKRYPLSLIKENLTELYRTKYTKRKPDVLIVSDNYALTFVLGLRRTIFKDVPVIFCGINNYAPEMLGGEKGITGVAEGVDMEGCLALVSRMHPRAAELVIVTDDTITGQMNLKNFRNVLKNNGSRFKIRGITGLTDKEVVPELKKLSPSSVLFYLSFFKDRFGKVRSMRHNIEILADNSPVPLYVLWDWAVPYGALGGVVTSGRMQGVRAGEMALKVLRGKNADEIPVLRKSPTEVLINYPKAKQYNINLKLLPENTVFYNSPTSFYYRNKTLVHITTGCIIFLFGGIITLLIMVRRERKISFMLENQRRLLKDILMNIPHYIFWKDRNLVYQGANEAFADLIGLSSPEEIVGKKEEEFSKIKDYLEFYQMCDSEVIETGAPKLNFEESYVTPEGKNVTLLISKVPLMDSKGRVTGVLGVALDLTERKKIDKELEDSNRRFFTVLNSIDATVYVADMETYEVLFMNKYMEKSFGRDMTGEKCWKAFRNSDGPCEFCTNDQLVDSKGNSAGLCVWEDRNPVNGKYYLNYDRAIEWTDGRLVRLQVASDISELKNMEEQLRQAQKLDAIGHLAGGVAHDFNNMLSIIAGNTELTLADIDPSHHIVPNLKEIQKAAHRSSELTRQLLAFARKQAIAPKALYLNETIEGMLNMLRRLIGEDIDLSWHPEDDLWAVMIDPSQVDQVLANLCVNGRDSIKGVGKITIETGNVSLEEEYCKSHEDVEPGDFVMLSVSDSGCGMDRETMDKIFEPFFSTKKIGQGTGLGLATVYGIVKQNRGFVNVYSEPDKGTTFKVYFPRHIIQRQQQVMYETESHDLKGDETILLVEDETGILKMATMMIESFGYNVLSASGPKEALRIGELYHDNIDLLITDVVMPEMSGKEVAEKLTRSFPHLKCLFMSGYTANMIAHHGVLEEGINFINKPFSKQNLSTKIREVLDSANGSAGHSAVVG